MASNQVTYAVPGVSCGHCVTAIRGEVEKVAGVADVKVDLEAKQVTVAGEGFDEVAVRDAIDEAGYEIAA